MPTTNNTYPIRSREDRIVSVLACWPDELADTIAARTALVDKLKRACRAEHERAVSGHWAYHPMRHHQMVRLAIDEMAALDAMIAGERATALPLAA